MGYSNTVRLVTINSSIIPKTIVMLPRAFPIMQTHLFKALR